MNSDLDFYLGFDDLRSVLTWEITLLVKQQQNKAKNKTWFTGGSKSIINLLWRLMLSGN